MNPFQLAQAHDGHDHGVALQDAPSAAAVTDSAHVAAPHAAEHGGGLTIGVHWQETIPGWGVVNADTVLYGGLVMLTLLVVFGLLARTVSAIPGERAGVVGTLLEEVVTFCQKMVNDFIGPAVGPYLWFIGSIFVFVLTANWLALLPWKAWETFAGAPLGHALGLPHALVYEAPTADLNMTLAMALITLALYWYFGIASNGLSGFLGHHWFDKPVALFPLRMLEDVTRPLSLALRLFANLTAGHVIGLVLLMLTYFVVPAVMLPLELFVGAVQAFVFAVLSASYIGTAAADHSHGH
ncbi:MAG: F0F1 ATP synthase subunit A [Candidatus Sericytochromatia bacterium]|nr:F0F1 ATP synthase subunit A [Candidatus Sericytochromatia bacterium]